MKKKPLPALFPFLCTLGLLLVAPISRAQIPAPADWANFVKSSANPMVRDTFRLQTFSGLPTDNWRYTAEGSASLFNAAEVGIANQGGSYSLKIEPGGVLSFASAATPWHTDIQIHFRYAAYDLMKGENLLLSTLRPQNSLTDYPIGEVPSNHYTLSYPLAYAKNHVQIGGDPTSLSLRVATVASTAGGFYTLDSVYAQGMAPRYSFFSGTGGWETSACWSHGVPGAGRDALVQGKLVIEDTSYGRELALGNGSIEIKNGARFYLQQLSLHTSAISKNQSAIDGYLYSEGEFHLAGTLSLQKKFPEAGQWYFISFPFDVYPEHIDGAFEWKGDEPNGGGNYFYVRRYNSRKRAESQRPTDNWEVIAPGSLKPGHPLFEKNRGYLIALDAKSTRTELSFSSRPGDIPTDFGHKGVLSLPFYTADKANKEAENHEGWCLCGNPFPAPLSLSLFPSDPSFLPYVYVYDGESYHPYPIGSDYVLPPYSAFFLKAKAETRLTLTQQAVTTKVQPAIPFEPQLQSVRIEPEQINEATTSVLPTADLSFPVDFTGEGIILRQMPSEGEIEVVSMTGKLLYTTSFGPGTSSIRWPALPTAHEVVFLIVRTRDFQKYYKYRLTSAR